MQVTCPVCQFKGLSENEPVSGQTQIVCALCATTYEVVLADGQVVETRQSSAYASPQDASLFACADVAASFAAFAQADDEILAIPQVEAESLTVEPTHFLEDVFVVPADSAQSQEVAAAWSSETEMRSADDETRPAPAAEILALDEAQAATDVHQSLAPEKSIPAVASKNHAAPARDNFAAGARVMQASPWWLLVCGLAFVSCIVFFNWITSADGRAEEVASARPASTNDATNQSAPSFMPDVEIEADGEETKAPATAQPERVVKEAATVTVEPPAPAPVETAKVVAPEAPAAAVQTTAPSGGNFTVQVGAHSDNARAETQAAQMKSAGFDARVVMVEIPKRGTWHRVQAGRFDTREQAEREGAQMRARGVAQSAMVTEIQAQ